METLDRLKLTFLSLPDDQKHFYFNKGVTYISNLSVCRRNTQNCFKKTATAEQSILSHAVKMITDSGSPRNEEHPIPKLQVSQTHEKVIESPKASTISTSDRQGGRDENASDTSFEELPDLSENLKECLAMIGVIIGQNEPIVEKTESTKKEAGSFMTSRRIERMKIQNEEIIRRMRSSCDRYCRSRNERQRASTKANLEDDLTELENQNSSLFHMMKLLLKRQIAFESIIKDHLRSVQLRISQTKSVQMASTD